MTESRACRYSSIVCGQQRSQDLSHLLSPILFQDRIGASGSHGFFQWLGAGVMLLLYDIVEALDIRNAYPRHLFQKRPYLLCYL